MPEYKFSQNISGIQTSGGNIGGNSDGGGPRKSGRNSGSIYNSLGKVHTGYYYNWKVLRKYYHKTVIAARKKRVASPVRPQSINI